MYRTYYPRHGNILRRQYAECNTCGGRRKIDSVDGGGIGRAQTTPPATLNGHQNGHQNGHHSYSDLDWAEAQNRLRRQMTQATYDNLIAPTHLISWRAGRVVIGASARNIDWLENRYREVIHAVLIEIDSTVSEISFLEAE